jgi:hypothetical protein
MSFVYRNGWTDQGTSTWAWRRTPPLVSSSIFGWYHSYFISFLSLSPKTFLGLFYTATLFLVRAVPSGWKPGNYIYLCGVCSYFRKILEVRSMQTGSYVPIGWYFPTSNIFSAKNSVDLRKNHWNGNDVTCVSVFIWRQLAFLLVTHFWPEKHPEDTSSW